MRLLAYLGLVFGLMAVPAVAQSAPDGAVAAAGRWTHPRGPASRSGRSASPALESFGGIRWKAAPGGEILAPPETWDGLAFVLSGNGRSATLSVFDIATGDRIAKSSPSGVGTAPKPACYERSVFLLERSTHLVQYRLAGGSLTPRWTYDAPAKADAPCVYHGEIYLPTEKGLLRLRIGIGQAAWTVPGDFVGDCSLLGEEVYALQRTDKSRLELDAVSRATGAVVARCSFPATSADARDGEIEVATGIVAVRLPGDPKHSWQLVQRETKDGKLKLTPQRVLPLDGSPLLKESIGVAQRAGTWSILRLGSKLPVTPVVRENSRPDLVKGSANPTDASGIVSFGDWAVDFHGGTILWHLNERNEIRDFANGVRFGAVPAGDGLMLVVSSDGTKLYAVGPEELGS